MTSTEKLCCGILVGLTLGWLLPYIGIIFCSIGFTIMLALTWRTKTIHGQAMWDDLFSISAAIVGAMWVMHWAITLPHMHH